MNQARFSSPFSPHSSRLCGVDSSVFITCLSPLQQIVRCGQLGFHHLFVPTAADCAVWTARFSSPVCPHCSRLCGVDSSVFITCLSPLQQIVRCGQLGFHHLFVPTAADCAVWTARFSSPVRPHSSRLCGVDSSVFITCLFPLQQIVQCGQLGFHHLFVPTAADCAVWTARFSSPVCPHCSRLCGVDSSVFITCLSPLQQIVRCGQLGFHHLSVPTAADCAVWTARFSSPVCPHCSRLCGVDSSVFITCLSPLQQIVRCGQLGLHHLFVPTAADCAVWTARFSSPVCPHCSRLCGVDSSVFITCPSPLQQIVRCGQLGFHHLFVPTAADCAVWTARFSSPVCPHCSRLCGVDSSAFITCLSPLQQIVRCGQLGFHHLFVPTAADCAVWTARFSSPVRPHSSRLCGVDSSVFITCLSPLQQIVRCGQLGFHHLFVPTAADCAVWTARPSSPVRPHSSRLCRVDSSVFITCLSPLQQVVRCGQLGLHHLSVPTPADCAVWTARFSSPVCPNCSKLCGVNGSVFITCLSQLQ